MTNVNVTVTATSSQHLGTWREGGRQQAALIGHYRCTLPLLLRTNSTMNGAVITGKHWLQFEEKQQPVVHYKCWEHIVVEAAAPYGET
jgi:hypothetical protein